MTDTKYRDTLKSVNGRRCMTKCYPHGTKFLHPMLMHPMNVISNSMCAIEPNNTSSGMYIYIDRCNLEHNSTRRAPDELEELLLIGNNFGPEFFLSQIYMLTSFDAVIYWTLENDYLPFDTIKRVHNCAWTVYGYELGNLSLKVYEYYYDIASTRWIRDYVKSIKKHYTYEIVSENTKKDIDLENVIVDILTTDFFNACIKQYVSENNTTWDSIVSHYGKIKRYIFDMILSELSEK